MGEAMTPVSTALDAMLQVSRTFGMREGMLRLHYELQRSSGLMSRRMRSVRGWDSWTLDRIAPGARIEEMLEARRNGNQPFFFTHALRLRASVEEIVGCGGKASAIHEAEEILKGKLPYFGQLSFTNSFPPRWFENPVTGQSVSPQRPWTHMRFASPEYGDLKFILEPSRFLFAYRLVRAYTLSGDERFPLAFWTAVEDWAHKSPPMSGPLWICGQESSLRILAWSFALRAFIHSPATTNQRAGLLCSMIAAHAWRTSQTLGYARSQRSNHLITEAVGLWTAGTLYPEFADARAWQSLGAQLLREAVLDQITPEGVSQQHSFNYQRMILHLLLWTLRLAEIHRLPLHDDIRLRAQAAYDFLRAWVDPISGLAPNYGSDDGSLILPLACASYRDFRPTLQLGAAVLQRPSLPSGPWDEPVYWFGMKPGEKREATRDIATPLSDEAAATGYFRLGDENSWALIRAGNYHRRPFQADQLHVDLWWSGMNIARDPGTYLYNGPVPWNNGFAGTSVHNTVTVDHRDQMRRAGRFLWLDWAQASGRGYASSGRDRCDSFDGEHDGYKNLGVTHRRSVRWLGGCGWLIVDDVDGMGEHEVRLHWLTLDLPFERSDSPFQVSFNTGMSRIGWNIFASADAHSAIIRGGEQMEPMHGKCPALEVADPQLLGWESPTYGDLRPAISLVCESRSQLPVRFVTVVLTGERCSAELFDGEIVISDNSYPDGSPECELYRVSLSPLSRSGRKHSSPVSVPSA
jgi:hypothetical protein